MPCAASVDNVPPASSLPGGTVRSAASRTRDTEYLC